MVNFKQIEEKLIVLNVYYSNIIKSSENQGDKNRATYGFNEINDLIKSVKKLQLKVNNAELKKIYLGMQGLSRGVEYFSDTKLEEEHRKLMKDIYVLNQGIKAYIKW